MNNALSSLPDESKVWVYQADRFMTPEEVTLAENTLRDFALKTWNAHRVKLNADAMVLHRLFLVLAADGSVEPVSGCSIDSSVAVVRGLGRTLGVDFFNRTLIAYRNEQDEIECKNINEFWALRKAGVIGDHTIVFNNLVSTVGEFRQNHESTFANSWHAEMFA
jgi:hypothetical protein